MSHIRIEGLHKQFEGRAVFDGADFEIATGKTTLINGPSGCGKTTLLRILAGLDHRWRGSIRGVPERISYMFQEDRLLPWKTLKQNIEFVLKDVMDREQMQDTADKMIGAVQLSDHEDKYPDELSGGMQRRAALARALCYPADLLLLDEPFNGLDVKLKDEMIDMFVKRYAGSGVTTVIVSHDPHVFQKIGGCVLTLR